jgi:hypothetical protein
MRHEFISGYSQTAITMGLPMVMAIKKPPEGGRDVQNKISLTPLINLLIWISLVHKVQLHRPHLAMRNIQDP